MILGFVVAFGTMFWFGSKRAFGLQSDKLFQSGIYNITRNPQVIGGWLLIFGISIQNPSLYSLVWLISCIIVFHLMVLSEEEHLLDVFGVEYEQYYKKVPRYLFFKNK